MSDELLFDSDRLALREARKRRLILIAAIVGILVIALIVALIIRAAKKNVHKGGEEGPYPYTWELNKDGSISLSIEHKDAPQMRWCLLQAEDPLSVSVTRNEKEKKNATGFVIRPESEGRSVVSFVLQDGDNAITRIYEYQFGLLVSVNEEGTMDMEFTNVVDIPRQGEIRGAVESGNPYRIYSAEDGDLILEIKCSALESDWECRILSGERCVTFLGATYASGRTEAAFRAGESGQSKVEMSSVFAGATITLVLEADGSSNLAVVTHQVSFGEKPDRPQDLPEETGGEPSETEEPTPTESKNAAESDPWSGSDEKADDKAVDNGQSNSAKIPDSEDTGNHEHSKYHEETKEPDEETQP